MNLPGKALLQVTGIIIVVFAGIDLFVVLAAMELANVMGIETPFPFALLNGLFAIFMGIMGIVHCNNESKANILKIIAIVDLVICGIFIIIMFQWLSLLFVVLPILYLIGALKNQEYRQRIFYMQNRQHKSDAKYESKWLCSKCADANSVHADFCKGCGKDR